MSELFSRLACEARPATLLAIERRPTRLASESG